MAAFSSTSTTSSALTIQNATNDNTDEESDNWIREPTPRIVSLTVFICFGFLGNLFLIITLCHSHRFRSVAFYMFVINLAVANICETSLNMTLLLSSSIVTDWEFADIPCKLNAFFIHLVCIETFLGLTILTTDRMIAVRCRDDYDKVISTQRVTILILLTWVLSLTFSLPILFGAVPVSMNTYIKYCNISAGSSITFNVFQAFFCVLFPLVLMIIFFAKIIRTGYKDRVLIRTLISQHNYNEDSASEPRIKQELRYIHLTGTLCVTWLVAVGPHVATSYFRQFQSSSELQDVADKDLKYVWYIDLILLWLRFSYTMALPVASVIWHKELWKSFKDMILCRKNNSVVDESFKKNDSDTQKLARKIKEEQSIKDNETIVQSKDERVFQVPVLFATSQGVHIQTFSQDSMSDEDDNEDSTGKGTLRGRKCDVIGSRDNLNNMEEDTSDYDSGNEVDPFSVSHPVSTKQLQSGDLTDRHRSSSQPEVRDKTKSVREKLYGQTVGSTSAGDSGLDLSTGNYISVCKSEFHRTCATPKPIDKEDLSQKDSNDSGTVMDQVFHEECLDTQQKESKSKDTRVSPSKEQTNAHINTTELTLQTVPSTENVIQNNKTVNTNLSKTCTGSPAHRRKKKKRKGSKSGECTNNSIDSTSTVLPLRPPPRLAPITNISTKAMHSSLTRNGSCCSEQMPDSENKEECVKIQTSVRASNSEVEMVNPETQSRDDLSIASFSAASHSCPRQTDSISDSHIVDLHEHKEHNLGTTQSPDGKMSPQSELTIHCVNENQGCAVTNYRQDAYGASERQQRYTDGRKPNSEAREKRRQRLSTSMVLSDNTGYKRLLPDAS